MERDVAREVCRDQIQKGLFVRGSGAWLDFFPESRRELSEVFLAE